LEQPTEAKKLLTDSKRNLPMRDWLKNPIFKFLLIFSLSSIVWFSFYKTMYKFDYYLGIENGQGIERWVSIQVGSYANFFTSIFGYIPHLDTSTDFVVTSIPEGIHTHGVWIGEPCNGIKVMGLFAIFIIAFTGSFKHKLWFIPLGFLILHTANAIRISVLTIVSAINPENLEFNHDITFQIIMYGIVFLLWYWWVNKFSSFKKSETVN
jgi:exosortase family protein XrtF